ncbi:MAG TPA: hypothetical protein VN541_24820 [Tepidisphaeraceae bacterium]|nr:hypothetical protein [Tepidisphaeraceae bacterium]
MSIEREGPASIEVAADAPEQFVRVASELAMDVERLLKLRREMRDRLHASVLLNHRAFAVRLERAFGEMAAERERRSTPVTGL